ncbi:MAG: hypothetical protein JSV94_01385 [Methanobacteriota archaeon]|nr:MAG: hypothetical protein JSV94_01385 [Euryarchaeota archaeon]
MAERQKEIFLSCFKCGRIVKAGDSECPRCGLQFGPGTLFECPFCSGLVWRNASSCSTCGIDLTEFSLGVEKTFAGFDMDEFVENIINTELEQLKSIQRRVGCPGCGLMIRGDEVKCPRCDLPLGEVSVICPVCGEKMQLEAKSCPNCRAEFDAAVEPVAETEAVSETSMDKGEGLAPTEHPIEKRPSKAKKRKKKEPPSALKAKKTLKRKPAKKAPSKKPAKKKTSKSGGRKKTTTRKARSKK